MQWKKQILNRMILCLSSFHAVEEIKQEDHQNDDEDNSRNHRVQLYGIFIQLGGTCLQLLVLSRLLLQVEVDISVVITLRFVVDGGIHQAEAFPDGSHQVGCLTDGLVLCKCLVQAIAGRIIIPDLPIAFCQCSVGTSRLIYVSILREEVQCSLGEVTRQEFCRHLFHIEILESREIVFHQEIPALGILNMLADGLQGISLPVRIRIASARHHIEADEKVELSLTDFIDGALRDGSARPVVIEIVEILCRILLKFVGIQVGKCPLHGAFLLYIIKIGGFHDVELALGIDGAAVFTERQIICLLAYSAQSAHCLFAISVKVLVAGFTLTDSHALNVCNKEFYLVVAPVFHLLQPLLGSPIIHLGNRHERQVVASLCIARRIVVSKSQRSRCQHLSRINITIVKRIRKAIQPINFALMRRRTG